MVIFPRLPHYLLDFMSIISNISWSFGNGLGEWNMGTWAQQPTEAHRIWATVVLVGLKPPSIWANYNDLTATSLEIMVSKGNHPKMALFQVSELL